MEGWATKEDGMTSAQVFVGIDVSKAQLDVALRPEGRLSAPNDDAGHAQILERLRAVEKRKRGWSVSRAQSHERAC